MTIKVLFFGATADAVGVSSKAMVVSEGQYVSEILGHTITDHPDLARHKLLVAVNEEYAAADTPLHDGDELAIFTAVSGG